MPTEDKYIVTKGCDTLDYRSKLTGGASVVTFNAYTFLEFAAMQSKLESSKPANALPQANWVSMESDSCTAFRDVGAEGVIHLNTGIDKFADFSKDALTQMKTSKAMFCLV